jgi:hypothetical protein
VSDASRVVVRAVAESTYGTTPAAALQTIRTTGFRLKRATQGNASQEIRSDAQIPDWVRLGANVEGEIPFEFVYGNLDTTAADFLAGAFRSTWSIDTGFVGVESGTDLLQNGTGTKSFTIEAEYSDITKFHAFTGCRVNTFSLSIVPGQIVTGSLGFMGKADTPASATVGTGAATAAVTGDPMNAVDHVSAITEGGSAVEVLGIDLAVNNGLRMRQIVGSLTPDDIGYGRFNVTGSIRVYFADTALLTKYNAATESSLGFTLTDADGDAYAFKVDSLKYTDFDKPVDSPDGDVIATLPFQGIINTTTSKTLRLTRNPA